MFLETRPEDLGALEELRMRIEPVASGGPRDIRVLSIACARTSWKQLPKDITSAEPDDPGNGIYEQAIVATGCDMLNAPRAKQSMRSRSHSGRFCLDRAILAATDDPFWGKWIRSRLRESYQRTTERAAELFNIESRMSPVNVLRDRKSLPR